MYIDTPCSFKKIMKKFLKHEEVLARDTSFDAKIAPYNTLLPAAIPLKILNGKGYSVIG